MEQFPGEEILSLLRDRSSSFTENAIKMVVEMHLVLCIYFILNVKFSGMKPDLRVSMTLSV